MQEGQSGRGTPTWVVVVAVVVLVVMVLGVFGGRYQIHSCGSDLARIP